MKNTLHSETLSVPYTATARDFQMEVYKTLDDLLVKAFFDLSEENFRTYDMEVNVMTMGTVATVVLEMWGGYDRNENPPRKWRKVADNEKRDMPED